METTVNIARHVSWPVVIFPSRDEAGRMLTTWINPSPDAEAVVFALPRGGLPVARPLADALGCKLLPALVRKLPIPSDPEMGFGAVAVDGSVRLNKRTVDYFRISQSDIERIVADVRTEVERRGAAYPGGWPLPDLKGRNVWIVDDGLATGSTMLSALDMLRAREPASLTAVVPCSPAETLAYVADVADIVWCFAVQDRDSFGVASYYRDFHDMTDDEVRGYLAR